MADTLKWLMPYDQDKHPTEQVWTPPYAIVNCWQELPEFDHRGLMCFLTGSVAMAVRGVYEWMFGIQPCLDGLEIAPCLPEYGNHAEVCFEYLNQKYVLQFENGVIKLNGEVVLQKRINSICGKEVFFYPLK